MRYIGKKKKGEEEKEKNPLKKKRVCVLHVLGDGRFDENFTFPISGHKSKCMAHLQKKNLCNQHNIHNLRVVEALLFLGIYEKSKNSQFYGIYIFIYFSI
jgi:hypothetical protein